MSSSPDNNSNFMDSKTLIAIGICAVLFFGWQAYMTHKYPDYYKPRGAVVADGAVAGSGATAASGQVISPPTAGSVQAGQAEAAALAATEITPETVHSFQNDAVGFEISSKGMGLQKIQLRNYMDQDAKKVTLGAVEGFRLFEIGLVGRAQPLDFIVNATNEKTFVGQARVGDLVIQHTMTIDPETSKIDSLIQLENVPADFKGLTVKQVEPRRKVTGGGIFMPSLDHQEFLAEVEGTVERLYVTEGESLVQEFKTTTLWGIGSQYFVTAILDQSVVIPSLRVEAGPVGELRSVATYAPVTITPSMEFKWTAYAGGKSTAVLEKINPEFIKVVNFGFFSAIGKLLLKVLRWAHDLVGNWGWAIIILTVIVRLIVLPFNVFSYKSMKKMQVIQPQLTALRTRYKEDPAALNRETMAIMREQKVNPLGGCLPILLQMPVFFALYQVLGQSIELYQAPFIFWVHDLSQKDPFYVLPVLMGVTMFIQQKITPTTMDPTQAKILLWMPLIFSVFTFGLPSGLTLYIFVSTLFGVIQQQLFMIDRSGANSNKVVVAKV
jgi:YidC/Oxa1 family membrane protein insertase